MNIFSVRVRISCSSFRIRRVAAVSANIVPVLDRSSYPLVMFFYRSLIRMQFVNLLTVIYKREIFMVS